MKKITLAIDVMGGDYGADVVIPACLKAAKGNTSLNMLLVGDQKRIELELEHHGASNSEQFNVIHASEVVSMDELPSQALRNKKDSSMRVAINLVKEGRADACVSAGNTGALMAIARFLLRTLPCIDRPAIITEFPTFENRTRVVDLGANVDASAEFLFQFAVMGSALIRALDKKENPSIALLNIGVEEIKGNEQIKRTAQMLSDCESLNYVGYVEGDDIFKGKVDLVVCDGFIGNVALKSSEGIAKLILHVLKESFAKTPLTRLVGLFARPVLNNMKNKMDPARYNGASLIGLNGIVIKSHGGADVAAFQNAIENAVAQVNHRVVDLVREQINVFVNEGLLL